MTLSPDFETRYKPDPLSPDFIRQQAVSDHLPEAARMYRNGEISLEELHQITHGPSMVFAEVAMLILINLEETPDSPTE